MPYLVDNVLAFASPTLFAVTFVCFTLSFLGFCVRADQRGRGGAAFVSAIGTTLMGCLTLVAIGFALN